jgi:hypothetical protein
MSPFPVASAPGDRVVHGHAEKWLVGLRSAEMSGQASASSMRERVWQPQVLHHEQNDEDHQHDHYDEGPIPTATPESLHERPSS